ncbi:hypothetical protein [Aeoliella sp. SH292]|uniref:hypothetical protein n=1 Tax=Aeoliella sp. SH292 TaxID=3454464 RepID=UPI003F97B3BA
MRGIFVAAVLAACQGAIAGEPATIDFERPSIGAGLLPVSETEWPWEHAQENWPVRRGGVVGAIVPKGPAANAGMVIGTIVEKVNRKTVESTDDLLSVYGELKPGDEVPVIFHTYEAAGRNRVRWRKRTEKLKLITYRESLDLRARKWQVDATGATVYDNNSTSESNNVNEVSAMVVESGKNWLPAMRFRCTNKDWLFVKKYTVVVGGDRFVIEPKYDKILRDNDHEDCWEWTIVMADEKDNPENWKMLNAIADARGEVQVVFHGDTYDKTHALSSEERVGIHEMRDLYLSKLSQ